MQTVAHRYRRLAGPIVAPSTMLALANCGKLPLAGRARFNICQFPRIREDRGGRTIVDENIARTIAGVKEFERLATLEANIRAKGKMTNEIEAALRSYAAPTPH